MTIALPEVVAATGAAGAPPDRMVTGWSTDSRTLTDGALFFALRGDRHDGHDHLAQAFERGACAAVVERDVNSAGPVLRVDGTLAALQRLAAWARGRRRGRLIAITGSAGKTTTKETIAHLLSAELKVGKSEGNYNNHIGVPLSLLRLPDSTDADVVEIGMNHAGEIRHLASIARPAIAVVTNAGYAHIENFDSPEGVALAKRELVEALPRDGVAVLNADDERVARFGEVHPGRTITFGFSEVAEVRGEDFEGAAGSSRFRAGGAQFDVPLAGRHAASNVLAALAVAKAFGIEPARLAAAARALRPGKMRGERLLHRGITILNDCYNSNPDAVRHMLDVLRAQPARRHIAVLGEMLELGRWSEPLHRGIGSYAAGCGISVLVGIRGAARHIVENAVESGLPCSAAFFFSDPTEAGAAVRELAREGDAILFKGSRGVKVELALERFLAAEGDR